MSNYRVKLIAPIHVRPMNDGERGIYIPEGTIGTVVEVTERELRVHFDNAMVGADFVAGWEWEVSHTSVSYVGIQA